jgi:hypothetical protein
MVPTSPDLMLTPGRAVGGFSIIHFWVARRARHFGLIALALWQILAICHLGPECEHMTNRLIFLTFQPYFTLGITPAYLGRTMPRIGILFMHVPPTERCQD